MCYNAKYIYNKYIRRHVFVDCGKCESCLQQKASRRANRIRYNVSPDKVALFLTLTYDTRSVPYIDLNCYNISMSQKTALQDVEIRSLSRGRLSSSGEESIIIYPEDLRHKSPTRYRTLKDFPSNCIGVCWYPDIQMFFKRLRINLKRHYNYEKKFTYFACSEYGGKTLRPHFHALIFIEPKDVQVFTEAIVESWPFADSYRTRKFIEIARDCASYVASYVNGNSFISKSFSCSMFRQRHSYSQGFGIACKSFGLGEILARADRGDMSFGRECIIDGFCTNITLPIPTYVINRYFPKFKGFSRLPMDSLHYILFDPRKLQHYKCTLDYTDEDLHRIKVSLDNAYLRYHAITGKNRWDFAIDFLRVWRCHLFTSERLLHDGVTDYSTFYEQFPMSYFGYSPVLNALFHRRFGYSEPEFVAVDISKLPHRIALTERYKRTYRFRTKQKFVSHTVLSEMGYNV